MTNFFLLIYSLTISKVGTPISCSLYFIAVSSRQKKLSTKEKSLVLRR